MTLRIRNKGLRRVKVADIIDNENNFRSHPEAQKLAFRKTEETIGFYGYPDVYETCDGLKLIDGELRKYDLIETYGPDTEIEVNITDFDEREANIALATHDPLAAMAQEDLSAAIELIDDEELAKLLSSDNLSVSPIAVSDDGVTSVPENKWQVTKGQQWTIQGELDHVLICGDSTDPQVWKSIGTPDLVFTSPPYSNMRDYDNNTTNEISQLTKVFSVIPQANWVVNLGLQFHRGEVVQYWNEWINAARKSGLKLLSWNVWDKIHATSVSHQSQMFACQHEWLFVFGHAKQKINRLWSKSEESKKRAFQVTPQGQKVATRRQQDGSVSPSSVGVEYINKQLGSVISLHAEMERTIEHPAKFPVSLPSTYIQSMTEVRGTVADPFIGSGTTMVAAEQTKRRCFGVEISPKYCAVILERMTNLGCKCELTNA